MLKWLTAGSGKHPVLPMRRGQTIRVDSKRTGFGGSKLFDYSFVSVLLVSVVIFI